MIKTSDYRNDSIGLWDNYNSNDKHQFSQPLYGVTLGNFTQVREEKQTLGER